MTLADTNEPILAIDPGSERSGWVVYDGVDVLRFGLEPNEGILLKMQVGDITTLTRNLALEMVASYGMPVGRTVFETCVWIGQFKQQYGPGYTELIYRKDVKMHLCGSTRAKDSNIRQALLDRYGGTRQTAIGTKKHPGPLYGVKADIWAALAVAITYWETRVALPEGVV